MASFQIKIKLGGSSKAFTGNKSLITIGKSSKNDLVLPFLAPEHLLIENTATNFRAKLVTPGFLATTEGRPLSMQWMVISSPGQIEVPIANGKSVILEIIKFEPRLSAMIIRDSGSVGSSMMDGTSVIELLNESRFSRSDAGGGAGRNEANFPADSDADELDRLPWWATRRVMVPLTLVFFGVLILGALGFNQIRNAAEARQISEDTQFVSSKITEATDLIRAGQFGAAKAALDLAEPVAKRVPQLSQSGDEIKRIRTKPEIQYGAAGYELINGQWLAPDVAKTVKFELDRDTPKIAELDRKASESLEAKKFDEARAAYDQELAIMKSQTVPNPKLSAVQAQIQAVKNQVIAADMTAKGLVLYDGRWMSPELKFKLEQQSKGLVFYNGVWMTKEQIAESASKKAAGLVLFEGKWMTPDDKMAAQGLVKVDNQWMKPSERDALLAQRKVDEITQKAEQAKQESNKKTAYTQSQEFLRKEMGLSSTAKFEDYDGGKVTVIEDQGWFIVQGVVTTKDQATSVPKTYYCKLRPKPGSADEWEAKMTSFAN